MRHLLAIVVLLGACGDDLTGPYRTLPLWSDGTHLRDADGRIALLHGVNARVEGVFDVTFDDGRERLEPIPTLEAADCQRMRALGFDLLRLPINWSAIEPSEGTYDDAYLARVDDALACAEAAGVLVLVDLHQDAYSKEIGEDGAPLWAIVPAPTALLEGPLDDLGARRDSVQVQDAFRTFFDTSDTAGLQAAFTDMLAVVGARWNDHPAVIGFEIYNEPPVGAAEVDAFQLAAAARLRAAAPDKLIFFEPSAVRNIFDFVPLAEDPMPTPGTVYAPHVYTMIFTGDSTDYTRSVLEASVRGTRDEAAAWGTPLLIGEYGCDPLGTNGDRWIGLQAELHDQYLASDAFWLWKEDAPQGAWGLFDHDATLDTWTERPVAVAALSRIHAARIAGEVIANTYDSVAGTLRLQVSGASVPHEIYVPERAAATFTMTCDGVGKNSPRDAATGLVSVECDGTLEVTPS
jgi:endoglycosylceramidase